MLDRERFGTVVAFADGTRNALLPDTVPFVCWSGSDAGLFFMRASSKARGR